MFEIILLSKVPLEISLLNKTFFISESKPKTLQFEELKSFSFRYSFVGKNSMVFCAEIDFKNQHLQSSNKNIKVLNFENNQYFIEILQKNAFFLQKKVKKIQNDDICYCFYQNGMIEIESQNELKFSAQIDMEILDANVELLKNNFVALKLFGVNCESCLVLTNQFVDVDFYSNAILEQTESGYKVLIDVKDICCHGMVKVFEIDEQVELVDEYSVYIKGSPVYPSNINVVPLYFVECIKVKDYTLAKSFLNEQLRLTVKQEHLKNFFGDFVSAKQPTVIDNKSCLLLEYCNNYNHYLKQYTFELKDGKITNIK